MSLLMSHTRVFRACATSSSARPARSTCVLVRAEGPRVVQGREFREADNSVSVPGAQPSSSGSGKSDGALYADQVQKQMKGDPKKGNLSPEMKAKLRAEYTGWGGAENKAMSNNYFLWVMAFVALLAVASHQIGAI